MDIATRRDNYNTLRSSPFRVAYTLDTFSPFLPLRCEMKLRCMHTARSSLSIFLFHSLSASFLACSPHASPSFGTPALLPPAQPKLNALAIPTLFPSLLLFSDDFSSSPSLQALKPHLASFYQLFLICYTAIPSPPSVLLPTGPHENTYFTGIHDGRRTSVRTCLLGCL